MEKLLFLLSLFYLRCFALSEIFIVPNLHNCTVNGTTLRPCYTLLQLNQVLSSFNKSSVIFLFMPGTHLIPEHGEITFSNFKEVVMQPWKEEQKVKIECSHDQQNTSPTGRKIMYFQNITELKLYSLHFSLCTLEYAYEKNSNRYIERSVNITKCAFEKGDKTAFAISRPDTESQVNVTVSNCTFTSNYNGLAVVSPGYNNIADPKCAVLAILHLTDTLFQGKSTLPGYSYLTGFLAITCTRATINNCHFTKGDRGISASYSFLIINNTMFSDTRRYWSPLHFKSSTVVIETFIFLNNSARYGLVHVDDSELLLNNSLFYKNNVTSTSMEGTLFIDNAGKVDIVNCQFINNSADGGGALYVKESNNVNIKASTFNFNEANRGGAILCDSGAVQLNTDSSFSNSAINGGFAYLSNCILIIDCAGNISMNTATNGGAIFAEHSSISFIGSNNMINNFAHQFGGALYLMNSFIILPISPYSLLFDHNMAKKGGAIFVLDKNCADDLNQLLCFFDGQNNEHPGHLIFTNNSAAHGGEILYGGLLDRCHSRNTRRCGINYFKNISVFETTPLAITSDPARICLCTENFELDCTIREMTLNRMRGQTINITGTVIDQDNHSLVSFIRASYNSESTAVLGKAETRIKTSNCACSKLSYHFFSKNTSATLLLQPEGYCKYSSFSTVAINITLIPCNRGFEQEDDRCICDKRLSKYSNGNLVCDIDADSIFRKGSLWLRYDDSYLKVHAKCPLNYCTKSDTINIEHPDDQCANNRSGVICGKCKKNSSIGLGGSKCLECISSYTLIWLIPVFAMAGVALVALLGFCNMTISHGTLNGLIFYANVVSITRLTSLQSCSIHPILSVFIAWVNLDFGVETCFYSGMDTYQKTWLQFAFPLYIWLLVGAIIVVSHYSSTAVKVFGKNNIALLATLFLLSYAKILKTIVTALNYTQVFQGRAANTSDPLVPYSVWTYDGNIEYLKGKHVPLFAVALVLLVFLILPYTLLLMFGQCIRSMPTQKRCVLCFTRSTAFISIMDAYHAPYNRRHRYWTGLMLLIRCVLFVTFASIYSDHVLLEKMYITSLILIGIFTFKTCTTRVYKNFFMNVLETGFFLNLAILSGTLYYLRGNSSSDDAICSTTSVSISISMFLFIGILIYHAYLRLNKTRCFTSIEHVFLTKYRGQYRMVPVGEDEHSIPIINPVPTTTTVGLREDLLASSEEEDY